jgi:hypothetical protein
VLFSTSCSAADYEIKEGEVVEMQMHFFHAELHAPVAPRCNLRLRIRAVKWGKSLGSGSANNTLAGAVCVECVALGRRGSKTTVTSPPPGRQSVVVECRSLASSVGAT